MLLVGHRGAKGEAPENTLAGFAYGRRLGLTAFELDVHLTADDQLVVIHDATVDRTTDGIGPVAGFTAAQLAQMDARAAFPDWPERLGVPTLAAVLQECRQTPHVQIEIKTDQPERLERVVRLLLAGLESHGRRDPARVTLSSFDPVAVEIAGRQAPDLPRAFISAYADAADLATARRLGCAVACIPIATSSAAMVRAAQVAGLLVTGWLGNTRQDLATLVKWGVDQITTDHPTLALATLREAGLLATEAN